MFRLILKFGAKHLKVRAFVSFYNEHGVYVKSHILKKLDLQVSDPVVVSPLDKGMPHASVDCIFSFDEIDLANEALMLLSLFDALATNHYYFLCEFGFTEKITWSPKQYDYLYELEPFSITKNSSRRKTFLNLYRKIEEVWLDFAMGLRQNGIEPYLIISEEVKPAFSHAGDISHLKEEIEKNILNSANMLANFIKYAYEKVDIIIGCGSFLSTSFLPLKQAFLISMFEPGFFAYTHDHRRLTVNPFILYWLITSVFCLQGREKKLVPKILQFNLIPLKESHSRQVPIAELKVKTYIPSKAHIPIFFEDEQSLTSDVRNALWKFALKRKKFIYEGEFIAPFSAPSIVQEINLSWRSNIPYLDSTPYGILPYEYGFIVPQLSEASTFKIEFFENPLQTDNSPVILDTNVIDIGYFPYLSASPFFSMFLRGREVVIPSIVIYELLRKVEIGKEKERIIKALMRLQELDARGIIKLRIIGETPPEVATQEILTRIHEITQIKKSQPIKKIRSDIRDALIIQAALDRNAFIFTNDSKIRALAFLLGVPSIKYHPLVEDVRTVIYSLCKQTGGSVSVPEMIEEVKKYVKETRGEACMDEDVKSALTYLTFIDKKINIAHDRIYMK